MPLDQIDVDQLQLGEDSKEMSFLEHLEELRWHIIRSLVAIVIGGIVLFIFHKWFFKHVIFGPTQEGFVSYKVICNLSNSVGLGDKMCMKPSNFNFQTTQFAEAFITSIKVSLIGGFVIAFPYVFNQFWNFIKPGLYENERKSVRGIVWICSILFMMGVCFGYFVIAPFATNFLINYTIPGVSNQPTLSSFIGYMVMFVLPTGFVFELPIVVYFLSKIGLVTPIGMKTYRRHAIIGILILAAVITPPDAITQFLIGIPLYILYEISIFISARVHKRNATEENR